jgi:hypothetical protein
VRSCAVAISERPSGSRVRVPIEGASPATAPALGLVEVQAAAFDPVSGSSTDPLNAAIRAIGQVRESAARVGFGAGNSRIGPCAGPILVAGFRTMQAT